MRIPLLAAVCLIATTALPQTVEHEKVSVKVIKVERIQQDEGTALWYDYRLTMRDSVKVYHAHRKCLAASSAVDIANHPQSCGHLFVPRAGATYTVGRL